MYPSKPPIAATLICLGVLLLVALVGAIYFNQPLSTRAPLNSDLPGDINSDGLVNIDDITIVTSNFGRSATDLLPPFTLKAGSTEWSDTFKAAVDPEKKLGYTILPESSVPLPWVNIDLLHIQFSQAPPAAPQAENFALLGTNEPVYDINDVTYNAALRTATLHLAEPVGADRLHLIMKDLLPAEFHLRFNVLPGDVDGSGVVLGNDTLLARDAPVRSAGSPNFNPSLDLDGSGTVDGVDVDHARDQQFQTLPGATTIQPTCDADINHDGRVSNADVFIWINNQDQSGDDIPGDINDDGLVDEADAVILKASLGLKDCRS